MPASGAVLDGQTEPGERVELEGGLPARRLGDRGFHGWQVCVAGGGRPEEGSFVWVEVPGLRLFGGTARAGGVGGCRNLNANRTRSAPA